MKTLYVILISLALAGCVTTSDKLGRSYLPQSYPSKIVDYPDVGEVRTAEVGESLIYKTKQKSIPAILVEDRVELPAENFGEKFVISLRPGTYVLRGKDENGSFYEAAAGDIEVNGRPVNRSKFGGVYVPAGVTYGTEIYVLSANLKPLSYPAKSGIRLSQTTYTETNDFSFKRELVYTGLSKNNISITYREYKDDFARSAFTQRLTYDLAEGKVIGFRGARFEILEATNLGMTYRALKPLN